MTNVHVMHGWVWKWGQQVGRNANWPCLGGSSGGDDPLHCINKLKIHDQVSQGQSLGASGKEVVCNPSKA